MRTPSAWAGCLLASLAVLGHHHAYADPLIIGFIDRPAYSWQGGSQAEGLLAAGRIDRLIRP
jgi:hypothetical protein